MFRFGLRLTALLALVGFLVPGVGEGQAVKDAAPVKDKAAAKDKAPDKDKAAPDKDKAPEKDKGEKVAPMKPPPSPWVKVGQLKGKIESYQDSDRSIRLQVQVPELNQGEVNALLQAQLQLRIARNAQDLINAQRSIAQHQNNLYRMKNETVTVKLNDEVKVRFLTPPAKFDEKGGLITKFTKAQLKEMKGPDLTLPGYTAEISDIAPNQIALVTLVQLKDRLKARPPAPRGIKKPDNADADLIMKDDYKPQVGMLLLVPTAMPGG